MKAMIFAAGLGTRLKPLTDNKPKALVELNEKTLLEHAITKLNQSGFNEIIINVHHYADLIIDFLKKNNNFNCNIHISDESKMLMDTGGGLLYASNLFNDGKPFLVYNVDVITSLDLEKILDIHIETGAMATLAVRARQTSRYFLFDDSMRLCGWENCSTGEKKVTKTKTENLSRFAFSGIQVINPEIFKWVKQKGKFSIVEMYLDLMSEHLIKGYDHTDTAWMDVGKIEILKSAEDLLKKNLLQ